MFENGKITNAWLADVGSELIVDEAAGTSVLDVDDALDFNAGGGSLRLVSDTLTVDTTYVSVDFDNNLINLTGPTSAAFGAGTQVLVLPIGQQMKAMVDLDDMDEGVVAIVPRGMDTQIDTGIREESEQEAVLISDDSGRWEVHNIDDERGVVLGSQVDTDGMDVPLPAPTDPPPVSPAARVTGTTSSLIVETDDVPAGTIIEYHISTTDGFTPTLGGPTKFTETESTVALIDKLPDGTLLDPGGEYFIRTFAYNSLGQALGGPSAQAVGALNMDNVDEFVTAKLIAAFIQAGKISVGQFTLDSVGMRVNRPGGGYVFNFPFSGVDDLDITAKVKAVEMTIYNALSIQGNGNLYGVLSMTNGVVAPAGSPGVGRTYLFTSSVNGDGSGDVSGIYTGLVVDPGNTNNLVECFNYLGAGIRFFNKDTGMWAGDLTPSGGWQNNFYPNGGIAVTASSFYIVGSDADRNGDWYIYRINRTTGAKDNEIKVGDITAYQGAVPTITTDGTNVYLLWINPSKNMRCAQYPANLSSQTSAAAMPVGTFGGRYNMGGAFIGNIDGIGSNRLWVAIRGSGDVMCFNITPGAAPSTWTRDSTYDFQRSSTVQGMTYDAAAGQMVSMDSTGLLYRYGKYPTVKTIQAKYAWYDANATNGTHETQPGPSKTYSLPARSYLTLQAVEPPDFQNTDSGNNDKANQVAMYATDDGGSTWRRLVYAADPWGSTHTTLQGLTTGTPKVTNEFASAGVTPGRFKSGAQDGSGNPYIDFDGAGRWRLGPMSGAQFGTASLVTGGPLVPIGGIIMYYGTSIPAGWLKCDGIATAHETNTPLLYSQLLSAGGTPVGTTPNRTIVTPDFRGRVPTGVGTARGLGDNEGAAEADRSLRHTHGGGSLSTASEPGHTHGLGAATTSPRGTTSPSAPQAVTGGNTGSGGGHSHNVSGTTGSGSLAGGENSISHIAVNFIIRAI